MEFDFRDIRREELNLFNYKRIHFIGIAGTGMSALAYIFAEKGYEVSGSDIQENISTIRLKAKGVKIYNGHHRENLKDVDVVIVSSAIPPENEEYLAAKEKNIPILHRSELLGELTKEKKSIIVSGTHGKTTTTSLIGLVLENNKVDPTIIVGGEVEDIGGNAKLGNGDFLVAEGDESDGSILRLFPFILVVTNIDNDHLDYYKDLDKIKETFLKAIDKIPQDGKVLLCSECDNVKSIIPYINKEFYTYGFDNADFTANIISLTPYGSEYVAYFRGEEIGNVKVKIPGKHNILNSLSALATAKILGLDMDLTIKALEKFNGVQRRLQLKGILENNILIFDDYGHHPTEIKATLSTLKLYNRRLVVIFQPHRYTRTYYLYKDIGEALTLADVVILTEIYSAGEKPILGVSAKKIYEEIKRIRSDFHIYYVENLADAASTAIDVLRDGDILLTIGAGNVWKVGEALLAKLRSDIKVEYHQ